MVLDIEVDGMWWQFISVSQSILDKVQASHTQILIMVHFLKKVTPILILLATALASASKITDTNKSRVW